MGQIVNGSCQFAIGTKDKPVHITKQSYIDKLRYIEQRYFIMWDEEEKRAWLTKGTSALLHLLRASLEHSAKDKFSSEFLFEPKAFSEAAHERFRSNAAIGILLNTANRKLRLYKIEEMTFDDIVERPDGTEEITTRTRRSYTTIEHRVVELFEALEKLIDHRAQANASAKGINIKPRFRSYLQGWDFRDIATTRDPLYLRVTTPPSSGQAWISFAESTNAVTLFGRGFGELIKPAAQRPWEAHLVPWRTVPTGKGYLTVCTADLRDLVESEGDRTTCPLTICRGIYWHNPSQHNMFAFQLSTNTTPPPPEWDPVQELLPASSNLKHVLHKRTGGYRTVDIDFCQHSAVIFGHAKSSKFTWPDLFGDPVIAGPDDTEGSPMQPLDPGTLSHDSSSADNRRDSMALTVPSSQTTCRTSPISSTLSMAGASGSVFISGSQQASLEGTRTENAEPATGARVRRDLQPNTTPRKRSFQALDDEGESQRGGISKKLRDVKLRDFNFTSWRKSDSSS